MSLVILVEFPENNNVYCFTKVVAFNSCLIFTPNPGEVIQFDYTKYFSKGLKPTTNQI